MRGSIRSLLLFVLIPFCLRFTQSVAFTSETPTKRSTITPVPRQGSSTKPPSQNHNSKILPRRARNALHNKLNAGSPPNFGPLHRAYDAYFDCLATRPLLTQSLTGAVLTVLGELVGNFARFLAFKNGGGRVIVDVVSPIRIVAFFFCGALFSGPYLHFWYQMLWRLGSRLEKQYGASQKRQALVQMIVDQTVGVLFFVPSYFYVYELMEALTTRRLPVWGVATSKLRAELVTTLITNWKVWPIFNLVNFTYIPKKFRFLASNVAAIFWNAYLCLTVS